MIDVMHGDALTTLRTFTDDSVDSMVTDPPAGISFMGTQWDEAKGGREQWSAWFAEIMREALRVVKPGGHALVWALPRTAHWTACGLEDAGWQIRDRITHIQSQGFPKGKASLKPAAEDWWLVRKPFKGSATANVARHGVGGLNIDDCRVPLDAAADSPGRWPTNLVMSHTPTCNGSCSIGCAIVTIDEQSGTLTSGDTRGANRRAAGGNGSTLGVMGAVDAAPSYADTGGASRFFPTFRYQAKAPAGERPTVDGVVHPTVKPVALMRWLCRLITPAGGVVLDPFAGSGTTGEAALLEGFSAILIESEAAYLPLIEARVTRVLATR